MNALQASVRVPQQGLARYARHVMMAAMLLLGGAAVPAVHAQDASAARTVETLHGALSHTMSEGARLGFEGRLAHLAEVLPEVFDFETIASVALGEHYASLDAGAKVRFRTLLERLSAVTYADNFKSNEDAPRFVTVSEQAARGERVVVRTRLERDGEQPVSLDYVLHDTAHGPRIVNVLAEGVSDLSLKRAQYTAVIRTDGVDGLLERIEAQVTDLTRAALARG